MGNRASSARSEGLIAQALIRASVRGVAYSNLALGSQCRLIWRMHPGPGQVWPLAGDSFRKQSCSRSGKVVLGTAYLHLACNSSAQGGADTVVTRRGMVRLSCTRALARAERHARGAWRQRPRTGWRERFGACLCTPDSTCVRPGLHAGGNRSPVLWLYAFCNSWISWQVLARPYTIRPKPTAGRAAHAWCPLWLLISRWRWRLPEGYCQAQRR